MSREADENPFRPPAAPMPVGTARDSRLAARGQRFVAYLLNWIVFVVPNMLTALAEHVSGVEAEIAGASIWSFVAGAFMLSIAALNVVWLHRYGASIGKRAVGVRIVRGDGRPANVWRILFLRTAPALILASIPDVGALLLFVDVVFIFTPRRRCLHDWLADTDVVPAYEKGFRRSARRALPTSEAAR